MDPKWSLNDTGPLEVDFPSTVELKGRTIECQETPEDFDCEWYDEPHFACHDVRFATSIWLTSKCNLFSSWSVPHDLFWMYVYHCMLALRFVCWRLQCTRRWAVPDAQRRLLPWHVVLRPLLGYDCSYWWTVRCLCYGTYKNCKEFALLLMKKVVVRRFHIPRLYRQNNVLVHFNFSVLEEVIMCELFWTGTSAAWAYGHDPLLTRWRMGGWQANQRLVLSYRLSNQSIVSLPLWKQRWRRKQRNRKLKLCMRPANITKSANVVWQNLHVLIQVC